MLCGSQIQALPGKGDDFLPLIAKLKEYIKDNEPDTLEYSVARDPENPDIFVVWERFTNVDALKT